jgi:CubicO group peptidase (beta-lactamase class C family)
MFLRGKFTVLFAVGMSLQSCFLFKDSISKETITEIKKSFKDERFLGTGFFENDKTNFQVSTKKLEGEIQLGELSKNITAVMLLYLEEQKLLNRNDLVTQYLPKFPFPGITIGMLLSHTSSLPRASEKYVGKTGEEIWNIIQSKPPKLKFPPGEYWNYSKLDYFFLAKIISIVTNKSYELAVEETFFKSHKLKFKFVSSDPFPGNSGWKARPEEYLNWISLQMNNQLISEESQKIIFSQFTHKTSYVNDTYNYGGGFYTNGNYIWQDGFTKSGSVLVYLAPKEGYRIFLWTPQFKTKGELLSIKGRILEAIYRSKMISIWPKKENGRTMTLDEALSFYKVPGVTISISEDFQPKFYKYVGESSKGNPIDPNTLFRAASLTKMTTAVMALRLKDKGIIQLDSDLTKQLKNWSIKIPEGYPPIPIDSILCHQSGLTEKSEKWIETQAIEFEEFPENDLRAFYPAYTRFLYSSGAYSVLGKYLSRKAKKPLSKLYQEEIFQTLGMKHSSFDQDPKNHAFGHDPDGKELPHKPVPEIEWGGGGLWTNSEDLLKLGIEIQKSNLGKSDFLKKETVDYLLTPTVSSAANLSVNSWIAHGVFIMPSERGGYFFHGGHYKGHKSFALFHLTKGYGIVIMTNSEVGNPLIYHLIRSIILERGWEKFSQ